ncbi:MAG: type II toxin-antitoxin system VapC family toxin [Methylococcales bacterium]|nr:type II toxin-antitoxin system VapC family toxin [Methylococcales bacterium]
MGVDSEWIAPGLIHSGLRNVFLGAVRRKDIALDDAHYLLHRSIELIIVPDKTVDGSSGFSLAMQSGCSAYDWEFVWLASDPGLPLVTVDKKVLKIGIGNEALSVRYLSVVDAQG